MDPLILGVLSRRQFLAGLGCLSAASRLPLSPASSPIFQEIPPARGGIVWTHENAMSPERYLPETLGPGCAVLDFDNYCRMDIYLVYRGPSEFFRPKQPLRNARYRHIRDG